jgi:hypothetical protein
MTLPNTTENLEYEYESKNISGISQYASSIIYIADVVPLISDSSIVTTVSGINVRETPAYINYSLSSRRMSNINMSVEAASDNCDVEESENGFVISSGNFCTVESILHLSSNIYPQGTVKLKTEESTQESALSIAPRVNHYSCPSQCVIPKGNLDTERGISDFNIVFEEQERRQIPATVVRNEQGGNIALDLVYQVGRLPLFISQAIFVILAALAGGYVNERRERAKYNYFSAEWFVDDTDKYEIQEDSWDDWGNQ